MSQRNDIGIIVILYHPTEEERARAEKWEDLYPTAVVDNSEVNRGIAAAQNIGLSELQDRVRYILLLDQDSRITTEQIDALAASYERLQAEGIRLGAISPRPYNKQNGQPYPYPCNYIGQHSPRYTEVTDLMSSGMLIATDALREIGPMDETLFIDGVDSEWCWRGRAKGYRMFVDEEIKMEHMLGMGNKTIAGQTISLTPPYRMYYMYRNYLRLCRRDYVPARWKRHNGLKYLAKAIYYPLMGSKRMDYIRNICRGVRDGLRNETK